MGSFCRAALEYVTKAPAKTYDKRPTSELTPLLLAELNRKPWLPRTQMAWNDILVAYHRIDAPQLADEGADTPTDRNRQTATNPGDPP